MNGKTEVCKLKLKLSIFVTKVFQVVAKNAPVKKQYITANKTIFMNKLYASFFVLGLTASLLQSRYEEAVCFLTLSSQIFLIPIWSTSEG